MHDYVHRYALKTTVLNYFSDKEFLWKIALIWPWHDFYSIPFRKCVSKGRAIKRCKKFKFLTMPPIWNLGVYLWMMVNLDIAILLKRWTEVNTWDGRLKIPFDMCIKMATQTGSKNGKAYNYNSPITFDDRETFSLQCTILWVCDCVLVIRQPTLKWYNIRTCTRQWSDALKPKSYSLKGNRTIYVQWRSQSLPGWATHPPEGPKLGKKWGKVWGKIRKIDHDLRKNEESGTLAHTGLRGWLRPCICSISFTIYVKSWKDSVHGRGYFSF